METVDELRRTHPLATLDGLALFVAALAYSGAMCPKCGFGTRKTSKRWARCKKCGERVERKDLPVHGYFMRPADSAPGCSTSEDPSGT